jgi:hypothetical protein
MAITERGQLIRLFPRSELTQEIGTFIIDRRPRGLSPRTVQFYSDGRRYMSGFLEAHGIHDVHSVASTHLRQYLLELSETRNPGGIHAPCAPQTLQESRTPV